MGVRIMTRNVTRLRGFVVRIPGNSFLVTRFIVVDSGLMSRTQMYFYSQTPIPALAGPVILNFHTGLYYLFDIKNIHSITS